MSFEAEVESHNVEEAGAGRIQLVQKPKTLVVIHFSHACG